MLQAPVFIELNRAVHYALARILHQRTWRGGSRARYERRSRPTTAWMQEVEQRREQLPRNAHAYSQVSRAARPTDRRSGRAIGPPHDCRDAGGRATQGAVADDCRAGIVPTIVLHFLHPWRSDGGGRAKQEARAESEAGGQSREQRMEQLPTTAGMQEVEHGAVAEQKVGAIFGLGRLSRRPRLTVEPGGEKRRLRRGGCAVPGWGRV